MEKVITTAIETELKNRDVQAKISQTKNTLDIIQTDIEGENYADINFHRENYNPVEDTYNGQIRVTYKNSLNRTSKEILGFYVVNRKAKDLAKFLVTCFKAALRKTT